MRRPAKARSPISFAASSDLAKQIENGAPASIFISADTKWMDYLQEKKLIVTDSRRDLLGNQLTLIAPSDSSLAADFASGVDLAALIGDGKLAMADPDSVPAGRYGKAALEKLGLWAAVEPKVVRTKDVRAALALGGARRGRGRRRLCAPMRWSPTRCSIADEFPEDSHPPIVYPIAIVAEHNDDAAKAFYSLPDGDEARAVFEKYGFSILGRRCCH